MRMGRFKQGGCQHGIEIRARASVEPKERGVKNTHRNFYLIIRLFLKDFAGR